jgi:hypothetical protein
MTSCPSWAWGCNPPWGNNRPCTSGRSLRPTGRRACSCPRRNSSNNYCPWRTSCRMRRPDMSRRRFRLACTCTCSRPAGSPSPKRSTLWTSRNPLRLLQKSLEFLAPTMCPRRTPFPRRWHCWRGPGSHQRPASIQAGATRDSPKHRNTLRRRIWLSMVNGASNPP